MAARQAQQLGQIGRRATLDLRRHLVDIVRLQQARHVGHKFAILAVDAVTAIFWFAGFIALAVLIGVPDCGNNHICGALQASVAFGAFLW